MKNVVILGLGWLGLPLAQTLKQHGYGVSGTVRTPEKAHKITQMGITCHCQDFNATIKSPANSFPEHASWILTMPPTGNDDYVQTLQNAINFATPFKPTHILFTSSTGVYKPIGQHDELSTEFDNSPRAQRMLDAEAIIKSAQVSYITVLRLSGLIGPKRHPSNFWKKGMLPDANLLINLVHQEDCIRALMTLVEKPQQPVDIFNLCAPQHPSRAQFYQKARASKGLPALQETYSDTPSRVIQAHQISERFGFRYQWPDLMQWLDADIHANA